MCLVFFNPCKVSASSRRSLCLNGLGKWWPGGWLWWPGGGCGGSIATPACRRCNECTGLSWGSGIGFWLAGGSVRCREHGEVATKRGHDGFRGQGSLPKALGSSGVRRAPRRGDRPRGGRGSVSSPPPARQLSLQGVWPGPGRREPRSPPPASFIRSPGGRCSPGPRPAPCLLRRRVSRWEAAFLVSFWGAMGGQRDGEGGRCRCLGGCRLPVSGMRMEESRSPSPVLLSPTFPQAGAPHEPGGEKVPVRHGSGCPTSPLSLPQDGGCPRCSANPEPAASGRPRAPSPSATWPSWGAGGPASQVRRAPCRHGDGRAAEAGAGGPVPLGGHPPHPPLSPPAALTVKFLTKRFISEYDPNLGKTLSPRVFPPGCPP